MWYIVGIGSAWGYHMEVEKIKTWEFILMGFFGGIAFLSLLMCMAMKNHDKPL